MDTDHTKYERTLEKGDYYCGSCKWYYYDPNGYVFFFGGENKPGFIDVCYMSEKRSIEVSPDEYPRLPKEIYHKIVEYCKPNKEKE